MDHLLLLIDTHLKSKGLEGFSNNGARALTHIIETLQEQEKKSPVAQTALAQIQKAVRCIRQQPAPALVKTIKNCECKVNQDVMELLERCKGNPSAIFEDQGQGTQICAVQNLKELHQLGSHLFNRADDLRRVVFCIIISDAHNIVNSSKWLKTQIETKTKCAIERLAASFQANGVDVPSPQLQENLQEWVICGAGHQQVMCSLGDGYIIFIPSSISISILYARAHKPNPRTLCWDRTGQRRPLDSHIIMNQALNTWGPGGCTELPKSQAQTIPSKQSVNSIKNSSAIVKPKPRTYHHGQQQVR